MSKRDAEDTTVPGVPELSVAPPTEPVAVLPGPQAPEAAPAEPVKRKRHRKAKPEPEPTPEGVSPQELENCQQALTTTFTIASKVAAKQRGEHWLLSDEEAESLGQVWTAALAPYLPKIGAAVPWATALIVTATMVLPRVEQDKALQAERDAAAATPPRPEVVR
jgi:hypothetical protein